MEVLQKILSFVNFSNEIMVLELLFCFPLKRRKGFWWRLIPSLLLYFILFTVFPGEEKLLMWLALPYGMSLFFVVCFLFSVAIIIFLFDLRWKDYLFYSTASCAIQHLASGLWVLLRTCLNMPFDSVWNNLLQLCCMTLCFVCGYFIFVKKLRKEEYIQIENTKILVMSLLITLMVFVVGVLSWDAFDTKKSSILFYLYDTLSCFLVLCLQFGFFKQKRLKDDNEVLEQLLEQQGKYHQLSKENIELINIKCHDIQKQIHLIRRENQDKSQEESLKEVENAAMIYDSVAKTGNETMDILLTEKSLYCEKYQIKFTYMVDSRCLDFLNVSDTYALFGNALDNAIESVNREEAEKRIISLKVTARDKFLHIAMENYCSREVLMENGLPVTTKSDKNYHGFGMKSIRYIVEKYDGGLNVMLDHHMFCLDIILPIPHQEKN